MASIQVPSNNANTIQPSGCIVGKTISVEGMVSGRLERLDLHAGNEFVLYPPVAEQPIVCHFEDSLLDQVREGLLRTVTVTGSMIYVAGSPFPKVVQVKSLEIHLPDEELPTLSSLRGFGKGCTGDLTAVDYVRSIRHE